MTLRQLAELIGANTAAIERLIARWPMVTAGEAVLGQTDPDPNTAILERVEATQTLTARTPEIQLHRNLRLSALNLLTTHNFVASEIPEMIESLKTLAEFIAGFAETCISWGCAKSYLLWAHFALGTKDLPRTMEEARALVTEANRFRTWDSFG